MLPLRVLRTRANAFGPLGIPAKFSMGFRCHSLVAPSTRIRSPTFPLPHLNRGYQHLGTPSTEADFSGESSFSDSERPDLYYHLVSPPTPISATQLAFALSFLPAPPKTADSNVILGWLPATQEKSDQGQENEAGLNDFKENAKFRLVLHRAVQDGLREGVDEIQTSRAIQLQNGWMHIHDERNLPALGRVGDPDDILASVFVENGKILPDTYQAMPSYRLCTSDGVTKLTPGLTLKLQSLLLCFSRDLTWHLKRAEGEKKHNSPNTHRNDTKVAPLE